MKMVFDISYDTTVDIGINEIMRMIEPNFNGIGVRASVRATIDNVRDDLTLAEYDTLLEVLRDGCEEIGWKNIQIERVMGVSNADD